MRPPSRNAVSAFSLLIQRGPGEGRTEATRVPQRHGRRPKIERDTVYTGRVTRDRPRFSHELDATRAFLAIDLKLAIINLRQVARYFQHAASRFLICQ